MNILELSNYDIRISQITYSLYRQYPQGWHYVFKHRIQTALYYIQSGTLDFTIGDRKYYAPAGSIVILNSNCSVKLQNIHKEQLHIYLICFLMEERNTQIELPFIFEKSSNYETMFRKAYESFNLYSIASKMKTRIILENIIYTMILDFAHNNNFTPKNSKLLKVYNYINENYSKDISTEDLCNISNYSSSHLRRLFLREFNISPVGYINKIRIEHAKNIFHITDIPIYAVAQEVGFKNYHYFSKVFHQMCGMTPGEYCRDINS